MTPLPANSPTLEEYAGTCPEFRRWCDGYGVFRHSRETRRQAMAMARDLVSRGASRTFRPCLPISQHWTGWPAPAYGLWFT